MSLNTLSVIKKRLKERPAEIEREREQGKKVIGWQGYNIPEELFDALELIPIRIAAGGDDRLVELGSRYISTKNCVFVRETVGLFAENKDPYIKNTDLLAFDATCLQTYRTAEVIEYYFQKEVIVLGVPRNFYWEEAKVYFIEELKNFVKQLEEKTGTKLNSEKLKASITLHNSIREKLIYLYDYQASVNPAISWEETYDVIQAGYYLDKREYLSLLEQLLSELQEIYGDSKVGITEGEARVLISGSVIPPGDKKLIGIIQAMGGRIVGDDIWSGIIPYIDFNIQEETVTGLALAYIQRTPHGALPYLELETDRRIKKLKEQIGKYKAKGVIYHTLRYCDPYTFKAQETKDILAKEGIPFLEIHTEYAGSDYEAIRTRIEAFIEMIKITNI